jgi:hypothetical protein
MHTKVSTARYAAQTTGRGPPPFHGLNDRLTNQLYGLAKSGTFTGCLMAPAALCPSVARSPAYVQGPFHAAGRAGSMFSKGR